MCILGNIVMLCSAYKRICRTSSQYCETFQRLAVSRYLAEVVKYHLSLDPVHLSLHRVLSVTPSFDVANPTADLLFGSFPSQQNLCLGPKRKQQTLVPQRGYTSNSYLTRHLLCKPIVPGKAHHKKGKQRAQNSKVMLQKLQTTIKHQRARTLGLWTIATPAQLCKVV